MKPQVEQLEKRNLLTTVLYSMNPQGVGDNELTAAHASPIGDVNGDGFGDIVVVSSYTSDSGSGVDFILYEGRAEGGHRPNDGPWGIHFAHPVKVIAYMPVGDFDNDGYHDLWVQLEDVPTGNEWQMLYSGSPEPDVWFRQSQFGGLQPQRQDPLFDWNGDGAADTVRNRRNHSNPECHVTCIEVVSGEIEEPPEEVTLQPEITGYIDVDGEIVLQSQQETSVLGLQIETDHGGLAVKEGSDGFAGFEIIIEGGENRWAFGSLGAENAVVVSEEYRTGITYRGETPETIDAFWGGIDADSNGQIPISELECGMGRRAGDVDGDGTVGIRDFLALSRNFGRTDAVYAEGDLNCDGTTDIADFLTMSLNWDFAS